MTSDPSTTAPHLAIVVGSTRPGRKGDVIGEWVLELANRRDDATFELVDLADHPLPHLDEAAPPRFEQYVGEHTKRWSAKIREFDGYVLVSPEYNHSTSGVLKNALDYLYNEWANKAVGFVGYGAQGGTRAVEHLRLIAGELQLADVRQAVGISLYTDFVEFTRFTPAPQREQELSTLLDQLVSWSVALRGVREAAAATGDSAAA
jgi:NAD(P)H-dependent FMN reductase